MARRDPYVDDVTGQNNVDRILEDHRAGMLVRRDDDEEVDCGD